MIRTLHLSRFASTAGIGIAMIMAVGTAARTQDAMRSQNAAPLADRAPLNAPARYAFNRVDDGFLRLDTTTGQVTICSQHAVGWACQAVPEDRVALEREIARLQDELAGLKAEVAALRAPPPPRPPADLTPPGKDDDARFKMPTHEDIERARVAVEKAWRLLVDMINGFQKDMMRKG